MDKQTVVGEDDGPEASTLCLLSGADDYGAKAISLVMLEEVVRRHGGFLGDDPVRESHGGNHGEPAAAAAAPCEKRHYRRRGWKTGPKMDRSDETQVEREEEGRDKEKGARVSLRSSRWRAEGVEG